jgi:hypothetical protein
MNISDNSISGGTHGLAVVWAINSTASHNSIDSSTQWGLVFERGQRCSITDNLVMYSEVGLGLLFNYQAIVERNSLIWNKRGIVLDGDSNGNVIRLNNISSNMGYGIEIMKFNAPYYRVQNNSIYLNSIRDNNGGEIQAYVSNDGNFWDDRASKGNYWSDYEGRYVPPATNDGSIWNVSYGIDGGDFDFFPLVKPPTSQEFIRMTRNHQHVAAANVNYSVQYKVFYSGDSVETLDWTFGSNASWLTFTTDHILKGKPSRSDAGYYWVDLSVTDGMISDHVNFTITVKAVNERPSIVGISNRTVDQWQEFKVDMEAIDDQTALAWSMLEPIGFLTIDRDTGVISGVPGFNDTGTFFVHIMVSDGDLYNTSFFFLTVLDTNDPPYMNESWDSLTLVEDEKRICPLNEMVLDTEGDPLSFSVQGPKGITAIIDDGRLVLDPLEDWTGRLVVPLNVSDGTNSVSLPIKVNVIGVNDPPRDLHITTSTSIFDENGGQVVSANFTDPDPNDIYNVSWYVDGNLVGYGISLNLTLEAGRYNLTMRVTDGKDAFSETSLWITVRAQKDSKIDKKASHYIPVVGFIALILILFAIVVALLTIRKGRLKSRKEEGKLRKEEGSPNLVRRGFIDEGLSGNAVPWLNGDGSGMDDLKMEVLDSEIDLRHDTSRIAKRLKNRERNGDITESEFEEINSVLERIKEE